MTLYLTSYKSFTFRLSDILDVEIYAFFEGRTRYIDCPSNNINGKKHAIYFVKKNFIFKYVNVVPTNPVQKFVIET